MFIQLLAGLGIVAGAASMIWYEMLGDKDKKRADQLAIDYASSLFNSTVEALTGEQRTIVDSHVRSHL